MNSSAGTLTRPLLRALSVVAIVVAASGCGDDSGDTADAPATVATTAAEETSAATEPAGTAAADSTPATTPPPSSEPATTAPAPTAAVESTLPPTTLPTPTTAVSATTEPAATAPSTTEPPVVTATTSPPAPSTTAAPIVIGGLTLATCIASEYFGFDAVEPRAEVALYQYTLRNLGYDPGAIDGYFGPMTIEAGANEIMDHTTDNAGLFIDEGVIARDAFVRLGIAC